MPKKKKETNEIIKVVAQVEEQEPKAFEGIGADELIARAIDSGTDASTLERLLAMRKELKEEWAREQFNLDLARFQVECPIIEKKKEVKDRNGKILYKYAPIDDIIDQVKKPLSDCGFSYRFHQDASDGKVKITCILSHRNGHEESSSMETGLATKTEIMSGPQQIASTVTFNKRYSFCGVTGIMSGDEDVDASKNSIENVQTTQIVPPITEKQKAEIKELFKVLNVDSETQKKVLDTVCKEEDLDSLTEKQAQNIIIILLKKQLKGSTNKEEAEPRPKKKISSIEGDTLLQRANDCKTQREASEIMKDLEDAPEARKRIIQGILSNIGFKI